MTAMTSRRKRPSSGITVLVMLAVIVLLAALLMVIQDAYETRAKNATLVEQAAQMELRYRQIDRFFHINAWLQIIHLTETRIYRQRQRYLHPSQIPDSVWINISMDQVVKEIRQQFWDDGIHLDTFMDPQIVRQSLGRLYGYRMESLFAALDELDWRYTARVSQDGQKLIVILHELNDINDDGDRADKIVYKSGDSSLSYRFKNHEHTVPVDSFLVRYSRDLIRN